MNVMFFPGRTSVEESSHSTPSPMSSAASSQDSLHRGGGGVVGNPYHPYHHLMVGTGGGGAVGGSSSPLPNVPGGGHHHLTGPHGHLVGSNKKQRGVKSTLGRIFGTGKKDKMKVIKGDTGGFMSPGQHSLGGNPFVTPPLTRYN